MSEEIELTKCPKCEQPLLEDDICYACDVCHECDFVKDECECGKFGKTDVPPWVTRGFKFKIPVNKSSWELVWPEIDRTVDPIQSAASFYLLEAMSAGVLYPLSLQLSPFHPNTPEQDQKFFDLYEITTKKQQNAFIKQRDKQLAARLTEDPAFKLQAVMGNAERLLEELVDQLDGTLVAYSHMAIAGELRHHSAFSKLTGTTDRPTSWCGWRTVHQNVGNEALVDAALMFYEFQGSGYGGPPWASCAETLYGRLEGKLGPDGPEGSINKRMFIDRFWTLEHNGGCFLNKVHWSNRNMRRWDVGAMRNLLNAHGSDPMDITTLLSVADEKTTALYVEYLGCVNSIRVSQQMEPIENILETMLKPKKVCVGCYSDVTVGHYSGCHIMTNKADHGFKPEFETLNTSWYNTYMHHDIEGSDTETKYLKSQEQAKQGLLPYTADGVLKVKGDTLHTLVFAAKLSTLVEDQYKPVHLNKTVSATFNEIVEGKVVILPCDQIQDLDIEVDHYTWSLKVLNDGNQVFGAAGMGYAHSTGVAAPSEWLSTPIDVAGILKQKMGEYELT